MLLLQLSSHTENSLSTYKGWRGRGDAQQRDESQRRKDPKIRRMNEGGGVGGGGGGGGAKATANGVNFLANEVSCSSLLLGKRAVLYTRTEEEVRQ